MDDGVYLLTLQASPRLWPSLQSMYAMVYKYACVYKLRSIAQKRVRSNFSRWVTGLYNSWMMIKIAATYEIMIIN